MAVSGLGQRRHVDNHDGRVGDRFDVQDPGRRGGQRGVDGGQVGGVDEGHVDPEPPEALRQQGARRAVDRPGRHDPVPGREDGQQRRVDGSHPGREDIAGLGSLELSHRRRQCVAGRVAQAGVRVAGGAAGRDRSELLGVLRREGHSLVDRDRVGALVDPRRPGRCGDRAGGEAA